MRTLSGVRVCMATSAHLATDDRIFFKEARSLVCAGADVVVLCGRGMTPPTKRDGVRFEHHEGWGRAETEGVYDRCARKGDWGG
jgi:hypothetical protein